MISEIRLNAVLGVGDTVGEVGVDKSTHMCQRRPYRILHHPGEMLLQGRSCLLSHMVS